MIGLTLGATVFTLNTTIPEMIDSMESISIYCSNHLHKMHVWLVLLNKQKVFTIFGVVRPMTYSDYPAPIVMQLNVPLCNIIV